MLLVWVWIPSILLKIENNKKIIFELLFTPKILFICLFTLFISHEQCNRCWLKEKKRGGKNAFAWKCKRNPNTLLMYLLSSIEKKLWKNEKGYKKISYFFHFHINFFKNNWLIDALKAFIYIYIYELFYYSIFLDLLYSLSTRNNRQCCWWSTCLSRSLICLLFVLCCWVPACSHQ